MKKSIVMALAALMVAGTSCKKSDDGSPDAPARRQEAVKANCGMVVPGGSVSFDVADRITKAASASPAVVIGWTKGVEYKPMVIWQDVPELVSKVEYDKSKGVVAVSTDQAKGSGNALVGLFPSSATAVTGGNCIWSWHVWVTDYRPDGEKAYNLGADSKAIVPGGEVHTYGAKYQTAVNAVVPATGYGAANTRVIMDRNLGATGALYALSTTNAENYPTYGLFYQWGRPTPTPKAAMGKELKTQPTYPQAGAAATGFPICTEGPVGMLDAVRNPHVFFYAEGSPWDWQTPQNDASWGDGTAKSVYDPCPEGWRVAPDGTWSDFNSGSSYDWDGLFRKNSEWDWIDVDLAGGLYAAGSVRVFYPAPGYRHRDTGALSSVGYGGFSYSSSVSGSTGVYLDFCVTDLRPSYTDYRAYGFQLRCLQE